MIRQHAGAGLVAAAVIAASFAQGLFEPGAYAAASIVVWLVVIPGLIGRVLPAASVGRSAVIAALCIGGIAVLATLSVTWAADQGRAFDEATRAWFYLGLFVLAACSASGRGRFEWLAGLTIGITVVAGVSVVSYLQPGLLTSGHSEIPNGASRLAYPFSYWNGAAAVFAADVVLLAFWGARASLRRARTAAIAAIPLVGLGIWLTSSRGGLVATAVGWAVLVAATTGRRRQVVVIALGAAGAAVLVLVAGQLDSVTSGTIDAARRADGDRMTAVIPVVVAVTAAVAWRADGWWPMVRIGRRLSRAILWAAVGLVAIGLVVLNPVERFNHFREPPSATAQAGAASLSSHGRWQFWTEAVDAFGSHPIGGLGAGGFEEYWAEHGTISRFVRNPHSLPLQQAAELGLVGLALLAGLLAAVGAAAWRRLALGRRRDAGLLLAVILAQAVGAAVDWTWQIPAVFAPALICAALLTSSAPPRMLTGGGRRLSRLTIATGWIALAASSVVAITALELSRSRDAAAAGHLESAIARAKDARDVEPWSGEPYTQLALIEEKRRNLPQALAYMRAAQQRDSRDWRLYFIEARLLERQGDAVAGKRALQRGHRLARGLLASRRHQR